MFDYSIGNNRVIDSYLCNAGDSGIRLSGSGHLIDNLYVCSYDKPDMDYYISIIHHFSFSSLQFNWNLSL